MESSRGVPSVGDIVKIVDWKGSKPDSREVGTVIRFEGSHRWNRRWSGMQNRESLAEVLWQDGQTGWILSSRIGVAEKNR